MPASGKKQPSSRKRRVCLGVLLSLLTIVLCDRAVQLTALRDGVFLGTFVAPFSPPLFDPKQLELLERYQRRLGTDRAAFERETLFDAELGWCPRPNQVRGLEAFDWSGGRIGVEPLPRTPEERGDWLALVGCSFTLGSEVRGEETWAAELEHLRPERRVGNFGVAGYGPDQAVLRYRRDVAHLGPAEVWLGFFPHAALRVSSHYPPLYHRWRARTLNFKPRFSLLPDGARDGLELHASPAASPEDIPRLLMQPAAFLAALESNDPWIARARPAYQPMGEHWSHHSAIARLLTTFHERGGRDVPSMLRDPTSEVFRLSLALVLALAAEVEAGGARFKLVVLPGSEEIAEQVEAGQGYWQTLCDALRAAGVEVLDLTPRMVEEGIDLDDRHWAPNRHYSAETHRVVARLLDEGH